jgi:hypothetical protein
MKILSTALFLVFFNALQAQITPQQIAQRSFKSTVLISINDKNQQPLGLGSGFVLENNLVATNFHIIENSYGGFVKLVGSDKKYKIIGLIEKSEKYDLAIISVEGLVAPKLLLGDFSKVEIGEAIYVIGNPSGLEGTFSQGIVSGIRTIENEKLLQITAPISPGSSGGPVMNNNGEVIGISVATLRNGQNLNFAIPIDYLKSIYEKSDKTVKSFFSNTTRSNSSDSYISSIGTGLTDGVIGTLFSWWESPVFGRYSFTVRNNLDKAIENVLCLIIFYDENKQPIETEYVIVKDIIAPGLAKRSQDCGRDLADVRNLTHSYEIRILDFEILK